MNLSVPLHGSRVCATPAETQAFGRLLGAAAQPGDVIVLDGPLGAGKTTLTQGIAAGMGVSGRVTSPTFVLARQYQSQVGGPCGPSLIHVDLYRLLDGATSADLLGELDALDLDTELDRAVVVAEWGGGVVDHLAQRYLLVTLERETPPGSASIDDVFDADARVITWRTVDAAD